MHLTFLCGALALLSAPLAHGLPQGTRPHPLTRPGSPPLLSTNPWKLACPAEQFIACAAPDVDTCCTHKRGLVVLALQWVTTIGKPDTFNIHGFWPDNCDGSYEPKGCDDARQYSNVAEYMPPELIQRLNKVWISFKGDNPAFWTYEWGKHGTCMSTVEPRCFDPTAYTKGKEVPAYFGKVADMYDKYDVYGALAKAGITPQPFNSGKTYPRQAFIQALNDNLGAIPQVNCTKSGELDHVNLMFKVQGRDNFILMDNFQIGNCPEHIKYPLKFDTTRPPPPPPPPPSTPPGTGTGTGPGTGTQPGTGTKPGTETKPGTGTAAGAETKPKVSLGPKEMPKPTSASQPPSLQLPKPASRKK